MGGVQLKCEMMGGGDRGRREEKKRGRRRRRRRAWRSSEAEGWRRGLKSRFDQLIQLQNTGKKQKQRAPRKRSQEGQRGRWRSSHFSVLTWG